MIAKTVAWSAAIALAAGCSSDPPKTRASSVATQAVPASRWVKPPEPEEGSPENPIIDSEMTRDQALRNVNPDCPTDILKRQRVISVSYYSFDGLVHRGQLIADARHESDLQEVFALARQSKFPIAKVMPISHPSYRWDDDLSTADNNTSAFNYRQPTGGGPVSKKGHAMGFAIDINPVQNPYVKGSLTIPKGAAHQPDALGTLNAEHPIVRRFLELGWEWGGNWKGLKDYQHFQKSP
ncbi:MAG: peptidoglycan L-alanyl-D-glutamate endopeptidase CwlK [Bradymonadia bacterium]|jgi:peptidoglycan L-alanyl-D-glutamate endopeptidase CwlK